MEMYYINNTGIRGVALGGVLLDLYEVRVVGEYWPRSADNNAMFVVHMIDGRDIAVTFGADIPVHRQMEEHGKLVNEVRRVKTAALKEYQPIKFLPPEISEYECTDPDGAWLMTGRALGGLAAWLYAQDRIAPDNRESEQDIAIKLVENFAAMVLGDTAAMDEFMKARDSVTWTEVPKSDGRQISAKGYGHPL